jgi:hypothetical protein
MKAAYQLCLEIVILKIRRKRLNHRIAVLQVRLLKAEDRERNQQTRIKNRKGKNAG